MEKYKFYERSINYYETDKMSVVHHSNYARFLEECRVDMLRYYEMPLEMFEEKGYVIPVLDLYSEFKESIKFGETVKIVPRIDKVTPVKFFISYMIYDETMTRVKHIAKSSHCFLNADFKPVSLKKVEPELYNRFLSLVEAE
ncbi:MAG: YbgC/FadM family acyl-CoA thioesterase [Lachnospiraceae bacterium]|nr:YbgC/FadM family acyl-CoA thioesterase [Lachnospiraceae bacterium]